MREDRDSLVERLHRQTAEYSAFKLENERLKVCMHWELEAKGRRPQRSWMNRASSEAWPHADKMGVPCCWAVWHSLSAASH